MIDFLFDSYGNERSDGDVEALSYIGARTAEYITTNEIGSLIFLDTAARNARHPIAAAMKQLHPHHDVDYYFVNPAGLVEREMYDIVTTSDEVRESLDDGLSSDKYQIDMYMRKMGLGMCHAAEIHRDVRTGLKQPGTPQTSDEIRQTLIDNNARLSKLAKNPDNKNALIFDQCLHKGLSLRVTKEVLESAFPDHTFYTGVTERLVDFTDYKPDFTAFQPGNFELVGCDYFGRYMQGSRLGSLGSNVDKLHNQRQYAAVRRQELARVCRQLDYS